MGGPISPESHEAPMLFRRGATYYLLFGHTCCFCDGGAGSQVYTAPHPLGPWTNAGYDINPKSWYFGDHTIKAQENYVFQVHSAAARAAGAPPTYIYTGDRWSSAPDHLKSHDFQYWYPLQFSSSSNDSKTPPTIAPMKFVDSFTLEI